MKAVLLLLIPFPIGSISECVTVDMTLAIYNLILGWNGLVFDQGPQSSVENQCENKMRPPEQSPFSISLAPLDAFRSGRQILPFAFSIISINDSIIMFSPGSLDALGQWFPETALIMGA